MMLVCDPCKKGISVDDETAVVGEAKPYSALVEQFSLEHSAHGSLRPVLEVDFRTTDIPKGYVDVQRPGLKALVLPHGTLPAAGQGVMPFGAPGGERVRGRIITRRNSGMRITVPAGVKMDVGVRVTDVYEVEHPDGRVTTHRTAPDTHQVESPIRPTWDQTFLDVATVLAKRGTCARKQVGAVLVAENRIISTGYNGAPPGLRHCQHHLVLKGEKDPDMDGGHCAHAEHAERNALLFARRDLRGSTMYVTCSPCLPCCRMMVTAGVARIVYGESYRIDRRVEELCASMGIELIHHA